VGDFAIIIPAHTDRSIVLKHGTGNIYTFNGADVTLDTVDHWAILFRNGARWIVMANSAGGGSSLPAADTTPLAMDPSDNTKQVRLDAGAVATEQTRAIQAPNGDCRVRDSIFTPILGPSDAWTGLEYIVTVIPANFVAELIVASCLSAGGITENPTVMIKKNEVDIGAGLTIELDTNNGAGSTSGRRGSYTGTPISFVPGDSISVLTGNNGAGSAGASCNGLMIHLIGYWNLV